jgi:hypothetical protein
MTVGAQQAQVPQLVIQVITINVIQLEGNRFRSPRLAPTPSASAFEDAFADKSVLQLSGLDELIKHKDLLQGRRRSRGVRCPKPMSLPSPVRRVQPKLANPCLDVLVTSTSNVEAEVAQYSGRR